MPQRNAAWKPPSNPGVWCMTNHKSRNLCSTGRETSDPPARVINIGVCGRPLWATPKTCMITYMWLMVYSVIVRISIVKWSSIVLGNDKGPPLTYQEEDLNGRYCPPDPIALNRHVKEKTKVQNTSITTCNIRKKTPRATNHPNMQVKCGRK